ncbi:glycosyltransferase [Actinoplanes sp. TFC3]|uniref:glycosyltransferase n=1 Tax=Actinoplanes sp. TFC3 TaxID=1710355 RepID=UPI0009EBD86F
MCCFLGHLRDRDELVATADIAAAPGPIETFGLGALAALASGTPTVAHSAGALPEVVRSAGMADHDGRTLARGVRSLLERPNRRLIARARAEVSGSRGIT